MSLVLTEDPLSRNKLPGYLHSNYCRSLSEFGAPVRLNSSGGWLLKRGIKGTECYDAMGPYPLFCCSDWSLLGSDLDVLREHLVTVAVVTDPFGDYDEALLRNTFDRVTRFKDHFVADLYYPFEKILSKHHRYYSRRAAKSMEVEVISNPSDLLDNWCALYEHLIEKHSLTGVKAFSREAFATQLGLPGMFMLRAVAKSETLGAHLFLLSGEVVYSHLAAYTSVGYEIGAPYALYAASINHFAKVARWLHIGAGAGSNSDGKDGLTEFKRGWATETRPVFFCGSVLRPEIYKSLTKVQANSGLSFFPLYRAGEF